MKTELQPYVVFTIGGNTPEESYQIVEPVSNRKVNDEGLPMDIPKGCVYYHLIEGIYDDEKKDFATFMPETPTMIYYINAKEISMDEAEEYFEEIDVIKEKVKEVKKEIGEAVGQLLLLLNDMVYITTTPYEILEYKSAYPEYSDLQNN